MSASIVIDASVAASWCLQDEASPATDRLLTRVRNEGGVVPALWHWEIANILAVAIRRRRLSPADAAAHLTDLALLPIATDADATARAWRETFALAQAHTLPAYDAAYLELAQRTGLDLATKDADLAQAARTVGVTVVP